MNKQTSQGWLMSLRAESEWGGVDSFLDDVRTYKKGKGKIIIDSDVYGRIAQKDMEPKRGDGFAFYHSPRAEFPSADEHKRKPRITLIGELLDIEIDEREVTWIKVGVDPGILRSMTAKPIVREGDMVELFEGCGIKQGSVATFYYAEPSIWKKFLAKID